MALYKKVVLFVLMMILPLNFVALSVTRKAMDNAVGQMEMLDRQLAEVSLKNLSARKSSALSMLYFFATEDINCIQMMRQRDEQSYVTSKLHFFVSLQKLAHMADGADGYYYYMKTKQDCLFYSSKAGRSSLQKQPLLEELPDLPTGKWTVCSIEDISYLIFVQDANDTLYGAWINLDDICGELISGLPYETTRAFFSQEEDQALDAGYVGSVLTWQGVTLALTQRREDVLRNISSESRLLYAIAIVYLVATPLLCGFIYHFLLKPLKTITKANKEIQDGNLDYRIREKGKSPEYDEVFRSFNAMAEDLKTTKFECYEKEAERQRLELRNLQLQIRPHFLLNIFNLVYTLAQRNQSEQIEDTILYLSDYFRLVFRGGNETELFEKELGIIRGYLRTANYKYRNLIEVDIDVAPEVEKVYMPPLLIHNFLENTVKHGIRQGGRVLHVTLKGRWDNGVVTFWVMDDGNGMDAQTLERNRGIFQGKLSMENENEHIGLYYSYRRLKAFFGEEATVEVESERDVGTSFRIRFPYERGEEDESADCKRRSADGRHHERSDSMGQIRD